MKADWRGNKQTIADFASLSAFIGSFPRQSAVDCRSVVQSTPLTLDFDDVH
ncbi:MAG TPA: hypothetical protein VIP11_16005 [Gemmatimonadaceae bacterium]